MYIQRHQAFALPPEPECERDAFACIRRCQVFALPPMRERRFRVCVRLHQAFTPPILQCCDRPALGDRLHALSHEPPNNSNRHSHVSQAARV